MIYPILQPTIENKFILGEDYTYKDVVVPKGYVTNGADIPRIFWIFVSPFKPKYLPAVIIHDFLIETAKNKNDIEKANRYFKEMILEIENSIVTRTMVKTVEIYWSI